jgi:hypothetical protein
VAQDWNAPVVVVCVWGLWHVPQTALWGSFSGTKSFICACMSWHSRHCRWSGTSAARAERVVSVSAAGAVKAWHAAQCIDVWPAILPSWMSMRS